MGKKNRAGLLSSLLIKMKGDDQCMMRERNKNRGKEAVTIISR